jgi:hypothetical protein
VSIFKTTPSSHRNDDAFVLHVSTFNGKNLYSFFAWSEKLQKLLRTCRQRQTRDVSSFSWICLELHSGKSFWWNLEADFSRQARDVSSLSRGSRCNGIWPYVDNHTGRWWAAGAEFIRGCMQSSTSFGASILAPSALDPNSLWKLEEPPTKSKLRPC